MPPLPPLPTSFLRPDLEAAGFVGWRTWDELRADRFVQIPSGPGVYVIYRPSATDPEFLDVNPGGHFKRRDPTVDVAALEAKWVPGAHVVYIGKADVAAKRLKQFARFGAGKPIGHWGGRYRESRTCAVRRTLAREPTHATPGPPSRAPVPSRRTPPRSCCESATRDAVREHVHTSRR
jgi:hypothetical protein